MGHSGDLPWQPAPRREGDTEEEVGEEEGDMEEEEGGWIAD